MRICNIAVVNKKKKEINHKIKDLHKIILKKAIQKTHKFNHNTIKTLSYQKKDS